jgi:DNA-binding response OmpR family regulator
MIEDMLQDLGFEVGASAACLEEALEAAITATYDFALLDINLRGEKVFPVATLLRELDKPFVFCSGYGTSGLPSEFGGCRVLAKPFSLEQLRAALASLAILAG